MRCRISRSVLDAIRAAAAADPTREVCGLLFGTAREVTGWCAATNVADHPERLFEIDPRTLVAAYRAERNGGPPVAGCYHSHPGGNAAPSALDAAMAAADGRLWLIVAGGRATLWRAVADGRIHGRFDPVVIDGSSVAAAS